MRHDDREFDAGDARLRYRDEGEGDAIVLVHGWTLDLEVWEPQCEEFRRSMRVVRLDRRGFGLSGGVPDAAADAADLLALLDRLEIGSAALVGMSQGTRAVIALALAHPARVAGLVLDGPPDLAGVAGADDDISFADYRSMAQGGGIEAFRAAWRRHPLMQLHRPDAASQSLIDRMLERYRGLDLLQPPRQPPAAIEPDALPELRRPLLVVNGEFDTAPRRRAGIEICRRVPGAEHAVIPEAGHLANLDNPRAYNAVVRNFLQRQSRAAA